MHALIRNVTIASLLLAITGAAQARNESLRCGSKLVKPGMAIDEVRKYCGEPAEAARDDAHTAAVHLELDGDETPDEVAGRIADELTETACAS